MLLLLRPLFLLHGVPATVEASPKSLPSESGSTQPSPLLLPLSLLLLSLPVLLGVSEASPRSSPSESGSTQLPPLLLLLLLREGFTEGAAAGGVGAEAPAASLLAAMLLLLLVLVLLLLLLLQGFMEGVEAAGLEPLR